MLGLNEAVGLKVDTGNDHLYVTDLGGSVYKCNRDGTQKKKIYPFNGTPLTGVNTTLACSLKCVGRNVCIRVSFFNPNLLSGHWPGK